MTPQETEEEGECTGAAKRMKAAATATDVSMELDILDCPFCYHPLRPPVFQVHAYTYIGVCLSCSFAKSSSAILTL
jgi:E3 ubiquitin-protein ligase SIAH1